MKSVRAVPVLWNVLTPAQRRRFVLLQFVSLFMALSTVAGLAAVMTFLAVLADPTLLETHAALKGLWGLVGAPRQDFLPTLAAWFIALLVASAVVNLAGARAIGRFAYAVGDRVRETLLAEYLRRDYLFHVRVGAGRLTDDVLNQSDRVTITLLNGQMLITNAALTLLVVVSIAIVNPAVAAGGVLAVAGSYLLFYRLIRGRVAHHGREQVRLSAERIAVLEQAFTGIKYLLVARAQRSFGRRLAGVTRRLSHSFAETQFIGQYPKYILECVAGAALIACAAFVGGRAGGGAWLAQLSFIAFAGLRLLPAVQQMYQAFVILRNNRPAIQTLATELEGSARAPRDASPEPAAPALRQGIDISSVSYRYAPDAPLVLANLTLHIAAGAAIGIVGASGSGKTTLVDLLLGLLSPTAGRIEIDGAPLDPVRVSGWQRSIGYVPQQIMILDASIRENIAFGVEPGEIDDARVREAARQAGAHDFIAAMPAGYATKISGGGAMLSGGQRQRLAIARALYNDPSLLIFDEATNALDADTERAIIDTVIRNRGSRTLLVVAHGAAVTDACDRVYELENGALRDCGAPTRGRAPRVLRGGE